MCLFSLLCLSVHLHSGLVMMRSLNCEIRKCMFRRSLGSTAPATVQQNAKSIPSLWKDNNMYQWPHDNTKKTAEKSFQKSFQSRYGVHIWARLGGDGAALLSRDVGGIYLPPNIVLHSPLSPEELWRLCFTYEWIIDGWLPWLLWTSVQARMLMLPQTQAHMKDAFYLQSPGFLYLPYGLKGCISWLTVSNPNSDS